MGGLVVIKIVYLIISHVRYSNTLCNSCEISDTEGCWEATHDLVQNPDLIWLQSITQFQNYANCTYRTDVHVTFLYGFIMFILSTIFRDKFISRYMSIHIYDIENRRVFQLIWSSQGYLSHPFTIFKYLTALLNVIFKRFRSKKLWWKARFVYFNEYCWFQWESTVKQLGSVCNGPMSPTDRLILKDSLDLYAEKTKKDLKKNIHRVFSLIGETNIVHWCT